MRAIVGVTALLLVTSAQAFQVCPQVQSGWAISYVAPITAIVYDQTSTLMYVVWGNKLPTAYVGVPITIMQTISRITDPVLAYNQYLYNRYPSLLLREQNGCPILNENGQYISTNGLSLNPMAALDLLQENDRPLLQENGLPILLWPYSQYSFSPIRPFVLLQENGMPLLQESGAPFSLWPYQ